MKSYLLQNKRALNDIFSRYEISGECAGKTAEWGLEWGFCLNLPAFLNFRKS